MKKRITAVLLMAAILMSLCTGIAGAADSAESALGEINIYNGGYKMSYLSMNGAVRSQNYTYYKYTNAKGEVKETPAYCINPTTKGVPQSVATGKSIRYTADEASSDPKIVGIISNGYPRYSASELGLEGVYHCYYATKMALWCYLIDDYAVNPTVMTAYLEYEGQIVTFEVLDSSVATGVSITKTGSKEVMPGQPIRYTLKDIANTSTVPLNSFYWRDTLPGQMTLSQIVTGTYNQQLSYKVVYKTNLSGSSYRTLADNLSTSKNYVLDARPAILKLASNERITEVMFVFGQVKAGFAQVETPSISGTVARGLSNGNSLVNVADVGGLYNGQWIQAVSRTLTGVYAKTTVTLPKTGY